MLLHLRLVYLFLSFSKFLLTVIPGLISVAFLTLLERKVLGVIGSRVGPWKPSFLGVFQPIGDAVKLANKQANLLSHFSIFFYYFSRLFIFLRCLGFVLLVFTDPSVVFFKYSFIILMIILGFNVLNSMIRGWRVYSKFSLIGRLRTVSQLVSYESAMYLVLFFFFALSNSLNISEFYYMLGTALGLILPLCVYFWVPCVLAELNRSPFDFSEGERELVRGFNTEYASSGFTLIFLAEYSNINMFCILSSFLFFSSYFIFFYLIFIFLILWVRSVLPRFRFDKLILLAWKFIIPFLTSLYLLFLFFFW